MLVKSDLSANFSATGNSLELSPVGQWTIEQCGTLELRLKDLMCEILTARKVVISMARISELDTAGAWLLERLMRYCTNKNVAIDIHGLPDRYRGLFEQVGRVNRAPEDRAPGRDYMRQFELLGRAAFRLLDEAKQFLEMLAAVTFSIARAVGAPGAFRVTSTVYHAYRIGWQAMPIIFLITFLIGGIVAQQGIFHFRKFGAEAYVVDMVGILVLRELGVLIVSIMVAGRSGSAFTAELGSMKMREEVDALRMMGFDPVDVLILPRCLALATALPILAFVGAMAALLGGGIVCWLYAGMSPDSYIARLRETVSITHFEVGMIKAPFMALIIGIVACSQGLRVKGSAESLGLRTTSSVVNSIFLVIVLDGLFAIFFASIGM